MGGSGRRTGPGGVARGVVVAALVFGILAAGGCYSPEQLRAMQEERAIDLDEEMDLLFACAVEAVEREVGVSQASVRLRRVRGEWQMEGQGEAEQRRQVLMTVVLDPARGPGVIAQHVRQERDVEGVRGGEGGAASDEGWRRRSVTSEDRQLEQALVGQTQACWQANSRHGDTGRRRAR